MGAEATRAMAAPHGANRHLLMAAVGEGATTGAQSVITHPLQLLKLGHQLLLGTFQLAFLQLHLW